MAGNLAGSRVVVTGAAGGVGAAAVAKFAAAGARVLATDLDPAVERLARRDGTVVAVVGDVSRAVDVERVFARAEEAFGGVDVLASNAAVIVAKSILDTGEDEWDRVMDTNAKSLFLLMRRALPAMLARGRGAVVATASISSVVGLPTQAAYAASKGAVLQLVRQTAVEFAASGVRINAVGPGSITRTRILDSYLAGLDDPEAGAAAGDPGRPPHGALGRARGGGGRHPVPRRAGERLHHRADDRGRRRLHGPLNPRTGEGNSPVVRRNSFERAASAG